METLLRIAETVLNWILEVEKRFADYLIFHIETLVFPLMHLS